MYLTKYGKLRARCESSVQIERLLGGRDSEAGDMLAAERATVLALADPLFDALCVEDVLLVAVERRHEVVPQEVAPADGTLAPHSTDTLIQVPLLAHRSLLVFEL